MCPVWIKSGLCSADSCINILLCILGYLPGLLHAWYIIAKNPEYDYETIPDDEAQNQNQNGRVTYYYISHEQRPGSPRRQQRPQNQDYGTQGGTPAVPEGNRPQAGSSSGEVNAPPSYADAVKGDHKVQRQE